MRKKGKSERCSKGEADYRSEGGREVGREGGALHTFVRLLHHVRVGVAVPSYPPSDHPYPSSSSSSIMGHHRGQSVLGQSK